jgi:hypothetical protein
VRFLSNVFHPLKPNDNLMMNCGVLFEVRAEFLNVNYVLRPQRVKDFCSLASDIIFEMLYFSIPLY